MSLDALIEKFTPAIPANHTKAAVATIQLHKPCVAERLASRLRTLESARAVVDPVIGTLLSTTCQVFVAELSVLGRQPPSNSPALGEAASFMHGRHKFSPQLYGYFCSKL
ncbi:hypothetical protein K438DRAFT_1960754 [Mycena galopus ATCC 62051]|nr:hypothetical protein K438DRAFT_1960754 [Mycena galopus ATCC 62051]